MFKVEFSEISVPWQHQSLAFNLKLFDETDFVISCLFIFRFLRGSFAVCSFYHLQLLKGGLIFLIKCQFSSSAVQ